jgi:hypothetical protein
MSSSIPTSCFQVESTVIDAPIEKVWPKFRDMKLEGVAPGLVSGSEVTGSGVGSVVKIHYVDGSVWEVLVTELSVRCCGGGCCGGGCCGGVCCGCGWGCAAR